MEFDEFLRNVYHEKQFGALCAVHCLNNLLQGQHFDEIDLMELANEADAREAQVIMESCGPESEEYLRFMSKESENVSDEGFFSLQVMQMALDRMELQLVNIDGDSEYCCAARQTPENQNAYVCNHQAHWFAFRKFGGSHWLNVDSMLPAPKWLSPVYIGMFIEQLRMEGYSIFLVEGSLPSCSSDEQAAFLLSNPTVPPSPFHGGDSFEDPDPDSPYSPYNPQEVVLEEGDPEGDEFAAAIAASLAEAQQAEEEEARRREEEERRKKEEEEEARKLHEAEEAVRREALEIQEVPADDPERKSIKFRCPSVPALNNLVFRFGKDTSVKTLFTFVQARLDSMQTPFRLIGGDSQAMVSSEQTLDEAGFKRQTLLHVDVLAVGNSSSS